MLAPARFASWLNEFRKTDKWGNTYLYHSRSDRHSVVLCEMIIEDLLAASLILRTQAARREVVCGINHAFTWKTTGKGKTLDLAIGPPLERIEDASVSDLGLQGEDAFVSMQKGTLGEVYIACEAKAVMTEHGKSQPRLFDELSSSHEIVHHGDQRAIAAGIAVVNIADSFVSPLRNQREGRPTISEHKQPYVSERMVNHLSALPIRKTVGEVGFDAYCTFVVDCDNQSYARLWEEPPAPQVGQDNHYATFLERIVRIYEERFGTPL